MRCFCYPLNIFDNHDCDIPKCKFSSIGFKIGSRIFSFHFQGQGQRSKVMASEYIGPIDYIMIHSQYSMNIWSKPSNIMSKHLTAILNATFKWPWHSYSKGQGHLAKIVQNIPINYDQNMNMPKTAIGK